MMRIVSLKVFFAFVTVSSFMSTVYATGESELATWGYHQPKRTATLPAITVDHIQSQRQVLQRLFPFQLSPIIDAANMENTFPGDIILGTSGDLGQIRRADLFVGQILTQRSKVVRIINAKQVAAHLGDLPLSQKEVEPIAKLLQGRPGCTGSYKGKAVDVVGYFSPNIGENTWALVARGDQFSAVPYASLAMGLQCRPLAKLPVQNNHK